MINISVPKKFILLFGAVLFAIPLAAYLWVYLTHPRPGSCLILEERYCKKVQFIPDQNTPNTLLAAYKVPTGTIIFSPIEGEYSNTPKFLFKDAKGDFTSDYPGVTVKSYTDRSANLIRIGYGFIFFKEKALNIPSQVNKNNIIGYISQQTLNNLGYFNLVVRIYRSNDEGKLINDSDLLKTSLREKK